MLDALHVKSTSTQQEEIISSVSAVQTPHEFDIKSGLGTQTVTGRRAAVRKAKELSRHTWRPVHVERDDERVKMRFRRGDLTTYRYETRHRRRRR